MLQTIKEADKRNIQTYISRYPVLRTINNVCFNSYSYGAALYLVQNLRKSIIFFFWLLSFKSLLRWHVFAMFKLLEAKCYHAVAHQCHAESEAAQRYHHVAQLLGNAFVLYKSLEAEFKKSIDIKRSKRVVLLSIRPR